MSLHAEISEETQARLAAQKRNATISSMVIACLTVVLIGLLLGVFLLPNIVKEVPVIVTYESNLTPNEESQTQKVKNQVQKKPTPPAASQTRVITSNTASPTAIPTVDVVIATESVDFGADVDFGENWGENIEMGTTESAASFFNQEVKAGRIAFVIDYSASMNADGRADLMRKELTKSVKGLAPGCKYQLIFFSGPAWVAGDKVIVKKAEKGDDEFGTVTTPDGVTHEWEGKGASDWTPKKDLLKAEWLVMNNENLEKSMQHIQKTGLVYGTDWENPLEMAIAMEPPPQIIFFMTDGAMGKRDMLGLTSDLARKAKRKDIIIHTIAMMLPNAEEPMFDLAKRTDGTFTIVEKGGISRVVKRLDRNDKKKGKNKKN